jgi:hypothetical protein
VSAEDEEIWQRIVAERGDEPERCCYCGLTVRPFSQWAAGAACEKCHGTYYQMPSYAAGQIWDGFEDPDEDA